MSQNKPTYKIVLYYYLAFIWLILISFYVRDTKLFIKNSENKMERLVSVSKQVPNNISIKKQGLALAYMLIMYTLMCF